MSHLFNENLLNKINKETVTKRQFYKLPLSNDDKIKLYGDKNEKKSIKDNESSEFSFINNNYSSFSKIDLFMIYHENSFIDLHDEIMEKYNNLGIMNKSRSDKFTKLLYDNINITNYYSIKSNDDLIIDNGDETNINIKEINDIEYY